jgi:lipoyl(octanoyl) transferase
MRTTIHTLKSDTVRLVVDGPATGQRNMAIDEALLRGMDDPSAVPVIRLYTFAPTTFSVGRFQHTTDFVDFAALKREKIDFVRRPSAGQAVLHENELTYCIVIGRNHLTPFGKREVYRLVVPLLIKGLTLVGVQNSQSVASVKGVRTDPDCFATTSEYEIDSGDNRKLIGSAQMVTRNGVLQHGSIPLVPGANPIHRYLKNYHPSDTFGRAYVSEQAGKPIIFSRAVEAFSEAFQSLLPIVRTGLSEAEERDRSELEATKYSQATWNKKY